jgi:hypothetical protein
MSAYVGISSLLLVTPGHDAPRAPRPRWGSARLQVCVVQPRERPGPSSRHARSPQITPPGVMPGWCAGRPSAATSVSCRRCSPAQQARAFRTNAEGRRKWVPNGSA